jgi:carbonic anhydrase
MTLTSRQTAPTQPSITQATLQTLHHTGWHLAACLALALGSMTQALANDPAPATPARPAKKVAPAAEAASAAPTTKALAEEVKDAVQAKAASQKQLTLVFDGKDKRLVAMPAKAVDKEPSVPAAARQANESPHHTPAAAPIQRAAGSLPNPADSRNYIRARAAAMAGHGAESADGAAHAAGEVHWSYAGESGPQAWGQLKSEFNVCAIGKRQSPINIEESATLQGPAEPLVFNYQPSSGTVVNNGHTIQVDLYGDNSVTVRGSNFKLVQFHFHHPSEERVNYKGFSMVAHLVHKNMEGQLAVVAVLLDPGAANALIDKVWTHMPLDAGDRVRLPTGLINMNELLPKDQRYYQFMGSLTTPPCTEGVLWMVLKQPSTVSPGQIRLFSQLFPNNARPVQAVNGRAVRDAQ